MSLYFNSRENVFLSNGLPEEALAHTAFNVFGGDECWDTVDQVPWVKMARMVGKKIDDLIINESEASVSGLAGLVFYFLTGQEEIPESLGMERRLAYNAVARHMVNVIESKNIDDIETKETLATLWLKQRIEKCRVT